MKPLTYTCQHCSQPFDCYHRGAEYPGIGRLPRYCSNACKQAAFRQRRLAEFHRAYPTTDPA